MSQGKPSLLVSYLRCRVTWWKTDPHELWLPQTRHYKGRAGPCHTGAGELPQTLCYLVKAELTWAGDFSQGLRLISIIGYIIGHLSLLKADSISIYAIKTQVSFFTGCKIICYYLNYYEKGKSKRVQEDEVTFKSTGKGDRVGHIGGQENKSFFSGDAQKDRSLFSCNQETKSLLHGTWRNTSRDSWRVSGDIDSRLSPKHTVSINSECRWCGCVRVRNILLLPGFSSGRKAIHAGELPSEDKKWWFGAENVRSFKNVLIFYDDFFPYKSGI